MCLTCQSTMLSHLHLLFLKIVGSRLKKKVVAVTFAIFFIYIIHQNLINLILLVYLKDCTQWVMIFPLKKTCLDWDSNLEYIASVANDLSIEISGRHPNQQNIHLRKLFIYDIRSFNWSRSIEGLRNSEMKVLRKESACITADFFLRLIFLGFLYPSVEMFQIKD